MHYPIAVVLISEERGDRDSETIIFGIRSDIKWLQNRSIFKNCSTTSGSRITHNKVLKRKLEINSTSSGEFIVIYISSTRKLEYVRIRCVKTCLICTVDYLELLQYIRGLRLRAYASITSYQGTHVRRWSLVYGDWCLVLFLRWDPIEQIVNGKGAR